MGLVSGFRAGSPDCRARGQRWAFMFRWSNGRKRAFDRAYPHRLLQMRAEENWRRRTLRRGERRLAAALAEKRKNPLNPPASTHTNDEQARARVGWIPVAVRQIPPEAFGPHVQAARETGRVPCRHRT